MVYIGNEPLLSIGCFGQMLGYRDPRRAVSKLISRNEQLAEKVCVVTVTTKGDPTPRNMHFVDLTTAGKLAGAAGTPQSKEFVQRVLDAMDADRARLRCALAAVDKGPYVKRLVDVSKALNAARDPESSIALKAAHRDLCALVGIPLTALLGADRQGQLGLAEANDDS